MRQLILVIVFSLILSITTPTLAINQTQERLSIPKLSLVEILKEFFDHLWIDIYSPNKNSEEESIPENPTDPPPPPDGTEENPESVDNPEEAWGPLADPNG